MKVFVVLSVFLPLACPQPPGVVVEIPPIVQAELDRCGPVVDAHLHLATWFSNAAPLVGEMTASGVAQGVILSVYGPSNPFGTDPNQDVVSLINETDDSGVLWGLASLNTTGNWNETRETELDRLADFLAQEGILGAKIAPPHTCLPLASSIMAEIVATIAASPSPVLGIHTGTTPFCGPFGELILGKRGCCSPEYVDPALLEPLIEEYPQVNFVLMHSGFDFLDPISYPDTFYNGTYVDSSIEIATLHDNVFLEISAMLGWDENGNYRPLALESLKKIYDSGLGQRIVYGSDANQFPGGILRYLNATIQALIATNFTEEERCAILVDNPRSAYRFEAMSTPEPPTKSPMEENTTSLGHDLQVGLFVLLAAAGAILLS